MQADLAPCRCGALHDGDVPGVAVEHLGQGLIRPLQLLCHAGSNLIPAIVSFCREVAYLGVQDLGDRQCCSCIQSVEIADSAMFSRGSVNDGGGYFGFLFMCKASVLST